MFLNLFLLNIQLYPRLREYHSSFSQETWPRYQWLCWLHHLPQSGETLVPYRMGQQGQQEISAWYLVKVANLCCNTLCQCRSSIRVMNNHSAAVLPRTVDFHCFIVFPLPCLTLGASCNAGLLKLLFWDVQRNERNTNNGWEDVGFIAATLHQIYGVLNMGDTLWEPCKMKLSWQKTNILPDELLWNETDFLLYCLDWWE